MKLGKRIKSIRKKQGVTQCALAVLASISAPYLHDIEYGRRNPSEKVLLRLAKALDVPVSDLTNEV